MKKKFKKTIDPQYPTFSEFNRKKFLNIATVVGLGVSASFVALDLGAKDKKVADAKTEKSGKESIKKKVIILVAKLGDDDFKEREKATEDLIAIAKNCIKKKDHKISALLKTELEKSKKSKDPEVKERAKKILLALTPPPPKIPVEGVDGGIPIAGDIAF